MRDFHRWSWWFVFTMLGCLATPGPEGSGPIEDNPRREPSAPEELGLSFVAGLPCGSNADCGRRFYCKFVEGQCGGSGTCELRPRTCTQVHEPVCGCDGETHSNACVAATAGASVHEAGECAPPEEQSTL